MLLFTKTSWVNRDADTGKITTYSPNDLIDVPELLGQALVARGWASALTDDSVTVMARHSQPYLSVEHIAPYTYTLVPTTATDVTEWDDTRTREEGGLDWGDVANKATVPAEGDYRIEASFVIEDGNNNIIGIEVVKNAGMRLASAEIEVNAGVQSQLSLDIVRTLMAGDTVWIRLYSDVLTGVDVQVYGAVAAIRAQWVV